ncbi:MAG: Crp/Fnr family transcriptional regulator [Chlorobi bacterium]|nr:Crp/Fnr family transcriptional regulator [Chlorobiota bacterium]
MYIENWHCSNLVFKGLTKDELALLDQNKVDVHYQPDEIIFKQESPCSHVISFYEGQAMEYLEGGKNDKIILRLIKPVEFISGAGFYSDMKHHFSLKAITRASACFIDMGIIKELISKNHAFANTFLKIVHDNLIFSYQKLSSLTSKYQLGRLCEALLYLSNDFYEANPFELTISKPDLGAMSNMSKESAYRLLHELEKDGLILVNGNLITLLNSKRLEEISRNS